MTERRRNLFILLVVVGLLAGSLAVIATKKTRLGLDLKGGVELVYEGRPTPQQPKVTTEALARTVDLVRERVNALGVSESEVQQAASNQIVVSLPDFKDTKRAQKQVGSTAQLAFYDWETNVIGASGKPDATQADSPLPLYQAVKRAAQVEPVTTPTPTVKGDTLYLFDKGAKKLLAGPAETRADLLAELPTQRAPANSEELIVHQGTLVVQSEAPRNLAKGVKAPPPQYYVIRDRPALLGSDVKNPEQSFDNTFGTNEPNVTFDFTGKGRKQFQTVTRAISQRGADVGTDQRFAAVLDNKIITRPTIDFRQYPDGLDGVGGTQISGSFTIESAQDLAKLLKIGALPIKLKPISSSTVSATLGKQALDQGLKAGIVGLAIVAFFLLLFYRVLGVIAVTALGVYALYFFALIKLIPITLTLPGIAGLILTIGVAADANIVIFERVKEEIRAGRSIPAGIAAGYKRGFSTILDANVVTIMTAFILFILATAGVKGFAFTLGLGTIVSLFTAVLATQAILGTMGRSRVIGHPSALGAGPQRRRWTFDFMGASRWFFSMSGMILLVGALAIGGKGLNFGIDFKSGTRIKTAFTQPANESQIRSVLTGQGYGDAKIQRIQEKGGKLGPNAFQISTPQLGPDKVEAVRAALDRRFGIDRTKTSVDSIGPTFGKTVANSALLAIIASLLVISAYIAMRFEWKFAVPVLIALMHDILITGGVYSLTGREVTTSTVAALLTILGFSLYDTIIVFDRVRENVPRMPRAAFSQIVNRSMSEVLTRSIATSMSTLLPVLALLLFGGDTLKDFAFALLVGIASGTYSSIFIASPVLTHWKEREPLYRRRAERIRGESGGVVPAYAVQTIGGQPIDVAPTPKRARRARALTAPQPDEVSKEEFDELVRDLDVDEPTAPEPAASGVAGLPAARDAAPRPDRPKREKPKRPRNRRHGRAR